MKASLLRATLGVLVFLSLPVVQAAGGKTARYTVVDIGTLGGAYSFGYAINDSGMVSGGAATPSQTDFLSQTAFLWYGGEPINLGTLGGSTCPDCSSEGADASANGTVGVISETANLDVNGEDSCAFGTHRQCLAAAWSNGVLRPLAVLSGGNNSQVFQVNSRGEMIGFSEIGMRDTDCAVPSQVLRFNAVKWAPSENPTPLAPLPGDTVSFGFSINDVGQAIGGSGLCSNVTLPLNIPHAPHAVLWEPDGSPIDLGTPAGGAGDNVPTSIDNQGDIVMNSVMADGTTHAILRTRTSGVLTDLGTYPSGSPMTFVPCCNNINDRGQIVGVSIDTSGNARGLLWDGGAPVDLNTLLPADSPWYVSFPGGINGAGEIAITAVNLNTFEVHAVVLTPIVGVGPAARGATKPPVLTGAARELVQRGLRF